MTKLLIAAFTDRDDADSVVRKLDDMGYKAEEISVISKENKDLADDAVSDVATRAGEGAATGGVVGGLAGLLAGAGIFPALAGLFIGGPIAVALGLTGVAAAAVSGALTGAAAGGLIGGLTSIGIPKEDAEAYHKTVEEGGVILAVAAKDDANDAREILKSSNGQSIREVTLEDKKEPAASKA